MQKLEGICWAKSYNSMSEDEHDIWCSHPDHYVVHGADIKHSLGFQLHDSFLRSEKRFLKLHEPLRGLELFAGMYLLLTLQKGIYTRETQGQVGLELDWVNLDTSRHSGP